jgi:hypothetical protein
MNNIYPFIKKEFLLLLILFVVFINPFFYGYRIAILFFVFIFFKIKYFIPRIDKNVFYLFLFATSYELLASLKLDYIESGIVAILPNIFVPSLLYLIGKYISINYRNHQIGVFFLLFIAFSFSLIPMTSILLQIQENGFIEGSRSLYLIWDKNFEISATGLGSYFVLNMASIGLINIKKSSKVERSVTFLVVVLFLLSLICVLRLGSRTQLVIAVISSVGTYLLNIRKQSLFKNVFFAALLIGSTFYLLENIDGKSDVMSFYSDRMNNDEAGIGTAGGRTGRWISGLESIVSDPFGWELSRFGYAHNFWLDVARVAGIIPLLFLVLFTVSSIKIWIKSLKILRDDLFFRSYIFVFFVSIILMFNVEPIMEGMYLLFLLFCLFVGFLNGIITKNKNLL